MNDPLIIYIGGVVLGFLATYAFNTLHQRIKSLEEWRLLAITNFVTETTHDKTVDELKRLLEAMQADIKVLLRESNNHV